MRSAPDSCKEVLEIGKFKADPTAPILRKSRIVGVFTPVFGRMINLVFRYLAEPVFRGFSRLHRSPAIYALMDHSSSYIGLEHRHFFAAVAKK